MKIQNPNLAGQMLCLRYDRDEDGRSKQVEGDAEGVFDVPKRDADFLLETPGWDNPAKKAAERKEIAKRAPAPLPEPAKAKPEPEPEAEAEAEEESEEGPDVDGLRTKADAMELAVKWRAKNYDIPKLDEDMKLSEMKTILNTAIYEG